MLYTLIFVFGLTIGSFLNAVIYRLEKGESLIKKRSHCPKCGHVLAWHELVPVISFVIQRRRCRACKGAISWQYPLIELGTALLFFSIFYYMPNLLPRADGAGEQIGNFVYLLAMASALIVIFVYDLKHYIIPDKIIYPAIIAVLIYRVLVFLSFNNWDLIRNLSPLLAALLPSTIFAATFFASRGKWLGFGDVKLVFFMGLFLGWPNILVALFFAFILGGIVGVALIVAGRKMLKSQVPFGPFLVTGTFMALFWGEKIINWYMNLFI